jgi:Ca2+-binding RTX toxin-like protein
MAVITGTDGPDLVDTTSASPGVTGGPATADADRIRGRGGDDLLRGGDGPDLLRGQGGDDRLEGGRGGDTLAGGRGDNTLRGGGGEDTASWRDLDLRDVPPGAPQVVLNLSGETIRTGFETDVVAVDFLVLSGTAARPTRTGLEVDRLSGLERFDGSAGGDDVAFLGGGFAPGGTDAEGFTAYSDGIETIWLRGFETVLIG